MWLVKNRLRATLSFRGLDISIPAGEQADLDALGRERAESSNQIQVAFEEGYLENVYKAPAPAAAAPPASSLLTGAVAGLSSERFDARMNEFREQLLGELRAHLPGVSAGVENNAALSRDMQALVNELKLVRDRFETMKVQVKRDPNLSDGEIRARLAFLEEQEQELLKNFETVGRRVEQQDGDVLDKADLLANL
jgi:hypothetical protein